MDRKENNKNQSQFSNYIVAVIDLLGISAALEKIKGIPTNQAEQEEFNKLIKPTFGRVKNFTELITKIKNQFDGKIELKKEGAQKDLTPEQLQIYNKHANVKVETEFFSDTAILKINLIDNPEISPITSAWNLLMELQTLMISSLAGGWPIRGAIELGVCLEMDPHGLFGQALSRAHHVESKIADYPRIVIGGHLLQYLNDLKTIEFADGISLPEKKIIMSFVILIKQMLIEDSDGQIVLDYLDRRYFERKGEITYEEVVKMGSHFVEGEIAKFRKSGNLKLFNRYNRLKNYFIRKNAWIDSNAQQPPKSQV